MKRSKYNFRSLKMGDWKKVDDKGRMAANTFTTRNKPEYYLLTERVNGGLWKITRVSEKEYQPYKQRKDKSYTKIQRVIYKLSWPTLHALDADIRFCIDEGIDGEADMNAIDEFLDAISHSKTALEALHYSGDPQFR